MDMDGESAYSDTVEYDDELDFAVFVDEEGIDQDSISSQKPTSEEWGMGEVKIVFEAIEVNPAETKAGDSPFFSLPV